MNNSSVFQLITLLITVITSTVMVATAYWKMNMQIKLLRADIDSRFKTLENRVEKTEKLDSSINRKLNMIGTNIAAILKKLDMKPEKDFFEDK